MPLLQISGIWSTSEELEEVRGGYLFGSAEPEIWHRCLPRRTQECLLGFPIQEQLHQDTEEAKGLLLVQRATRPTLPRRPGA